MRASGTLLSVLAASGLFAGAVLAQSGENGFPAAVTKAGPPVASAGASAALPAITTKAPADIIPAKQLFGAAKEPAPIAAKAIGGYARGCLAGARALSGDGPAWQAMRLSRNRNWGHPELVAWLEEFAIAASKEDGWAGLLVGDMSQPRGGPMLTGHASHQIGLDADIWFTPMPSRRLSYEEREQMSAVSMLGSDRLSVDPERWDAARARIIKRAAQSPKVERIFVHPAIKKALCESASSMGADRSWLSKVRAYWGHHYHFHVRMGCPKGSTGCTPQPPPPGDDGCGTELAYWYKLLTAPPKPPGPPRPPAPPMTIDRLPAECRVVLEAGPPGGAARASANGPTAAPAGKR